MELLPKYCQLYNWLKVSLIVHLAKLLVVIWKHGRKLGWIKQNVPT